MVAVPAFALTRNRAANRKSGNSDEGHMSVVAPCLLRKILDTAEYDLSKTINRLVLPLVYTVQNPKGDETYNIHCFNSYISAVNVYVQSVLL